MSTSAQSLEPHGASAPTWHDTGLPWPAHESALCFDQKNPHVFYTYERDAGTFAYNWETGQRNLLTPSYAACGPRGLLYAQTPTGVQIISLESPVGTPIDRLPTHIASDGSLQVYSVPGLWSSSDGGVTWRESGGACCSTLNDLNSLIVTEADARSIYEVSPGRDLKGNPAPPTLMYSSDAGATWQARGPANPIVGESPDGTFWASLPGPNAPTSLLLHTQIYYGTSTSVKSARREVYFSNDGGISLATEALGTNGYGDRLVPLYTGSGLLRYVRDKFTLKVQLQLSSDRGNTWQTLNSPTPIADMAAPNGVPGDVFLDGGRTLYYSPDAGQSWQPFPNLTATEVWDKYAGEYSFTPYRLDVTPYLPLTVLGNKDGRLQVLDLPLDLKGVTEQALPTGNPGTLYFPETGHNMSAYFAGYWKTHGGLAQLGYPLTEPFQMISDVDNKVYLMQYFERAVFELHPENQPPYNVLLSLLGDEEYKQKYGAAGAPDQHVSTDNPLYFPQTGHSIGGKFRKYWEEHGGLSQQGYPISDQFTEVSPLDGKPYTVQYFERAVFELHPENAGTPYEVLLSQLGTLRAKQLILPELDRPAVAATATP